MTAIRFPDQSVPLGAVLERPARTPAEPADAAVPVPFVATGGVDA